MPDALFKPLSIGNVVIPNRLVRSATIECMCPEPGRISAQYLRLYDGLARGGAGLIVTGNFFVHPLGAAQPNILVLDSDAVIPELEKVSGTARGHGALIFGQLNHGGRYCVPSHIGGPPLAPSAVRERINRVVPRPMTEEDIEAAISAFVSAALRLERAGFDGVEINASHGYLANQFLSGRTNRRKDGWGGTPENRARFLTETVRRVRDRVRFPVTVKVNGEDYARGGVSLRESAALARRLQDAGACGITVSGGLKESPFTTMDRGSVPRGLILGARRGLERLRAGLFVALQQSGARFREAYFLENAAAIRKNVSIPVTAVGGFRSVEVMEGAVSGGKADFIGLCRPFIREPDFPRLIRGGRSASQCTNCNQCLIRTVLLYEPVRCHALKAGTKA